VIFVHHINELIEGANLSGGMHQFSSELGFQGVQGDRLSIYHTYRELIAIFHDRISFLH